MKQLRQWLTSFRLAESTNETIADWHFEDSRAHGISAAYNPFVTEADARAMVAAYRKGIEAFTAWIMANGERIDSAHWAYLAPGPVDQAAYESIEPNAFTDTEAQYIAKQHAQMKAFHPLVLEARVACEAQPFDARTPTFEGMTAKLFGTDSAHHQAVREYLAYSRSRSGL